MSIERQVNNQGENQDPTRHLREYIGRRKVNGWLIVVMPGVLPYTNGHSRAHLLKTRAAMELCQERKRQAIRDLQPVNQSKRE